MSEKKKINKKSIEYVRPEPGSFNLAAFPGVEFKFKKIFLDDEAWVIDTFGKNIWEIINNKQVHAADLCRMYFRFLEDASKVHFKPEEIETLDYETNEVKKELVNGPKKFMRSIDGGSVTELILIAQAFLKTLIASRPISDLPEDVKKNVMEAIAEAKAQKKKLSESKEILKEMSQ